LIREGLGYVRRDPTVRGYLTATVFFTVFASSYTQLLPAVAQSTLHVGPLELSWLVSASGLGSLIGALTLTPMGGWKQPRRVLIVMAFVFAGLVAALGVQRSLVGTLIVVGLLGWANITFSGGIGNLLIMVPDRFRGRVQGLFGTFYFTGVQLGTLLLGTAGSLVGVSNAILGAGLAAVVAAVVMSRVRAMRESVELTEQ
jgi:predicted MFS family arabinose efflux permease